LPRVLRSTKPDPVPDGDITPTPELSWKEFQETFSWNQGEHVTMIGTTGSGKTTLAREILPTRSYVVVFGVKRRDDTLDDFRRDGYLRIKDWGHNGIGNRLILWPEIRGAGHTDEQRRVFIDAMDAIYRQGGWCIVSDETSYLDDVLGMEKWIKFILQQGRASGVSMVNMTQRPAFIPLACYDQATHLFLWRDNDRRNLQRVGEMAGNARHVVEREVAELRRREVLYLNKDSGDRVRTIVEV
jgi:energy-coupling factor transporter ATP-binding protein EcfA2